MSDSTTRRFYTKKILGAVLYMYAVGCAAQQIADQRPEWPTFSENIVASEGTTVTASRSEVPVPGAPVLSTESIANQSAQGGQAMPTTAGLSAPDDQQITDPGDSAIAAAVADGVTTGLAISSGALEVNPLISTSPVGLVAITGMKIGLVKYADTLPQEDKRTVMKTTSALWGGAAVNNLMVLMAAPPPFPVIAGLIMGFATWKHMEDQYQKEDEMIAAREPKVPAEVSSVSPVPPVAQRDSLMVDVADTSGR